MYRAVVADLQSLPDGVRDTVFARIISAHCTSGMAKPRMTIQFPINALFQVCDQSPGTLTTL